MPAVLEDVVAFPLDACDVLAVEDGVPAGVDELLVKVEEDFFSDMLDESAVWSLRERERRLEEDDAGVERELELACTSGGGGLEGGTGNARA